MATSTVCATRTLPEEVAAIAYQNKAVVYNILFAATADTLRTIAADPKHLGAEVGFFAVLHTWGQTLVHHPHLHCVVPGGGLSADGERLLQTSSATREETNTDTPTDYRDRCGTLTGTSLHLCPVCRRGRMITVEQLSPLTGSVYLTVPDIS